MDDRPADDAATAAASLAPSAEALAEIDRLDQVCKASPGEIGPQIELWTAVTSLDYWVCIDRDKAEAPRPYMIAAEPGLMVCIYTSATRATEAAHANGLVPDGDPVPLIVASLPGALDWVMSFGEHGVVGATVDYPRLGSWCPLPNLAQLKQMRVDSPPQ